MVKDLRRLEQPAAHGGPSLAGRGAAPGRDPGPSSAGDQRPSAVNPGERRGVRRWPNCATSGCPCPRRRRFTKLRLGRATQRRAERRRPDRARARREVRGPLPVLRDKVL